MAGRGKEFMIYRDVVTGEVFGAYPEKAQENITNQKPATFQ